MSQFKFKSLTFNTNIASCNGMCKRVLNDIEGLSYDSKDLLDAYLTDKNQGGCNYSAIIKLGQLLKELEDRTISLR